MRRIWQSRQDCASHCEDCPGCDAPYPLLGVGNDKAKVMLVGQEPAYNVDEDNIDMDMSYAEAKGQFIQDRRDSMNPLWKHMMNVALAIGTAPSNLYFTNLAKCDDGDSDWQVRAEQCSPWLAYEVAYVDPEVLLLYGNKVIQEVFEMFDIEFPGSIKEIQGQTYQTNSLTLVPLYHWGYAYRQGNVDEYNETVRETVKEVI